MKDSPNPAGDHRESDEAAAQAILVQQLSQEVRALRRLLFSTVFQVLMAWLRRASMPCGAAGAGS